MTILDGPPAAPPEAEGYIRTLRSRGAHAKSVPASKRDTVSGKRVMVYNVLDQAASSATNFSVAFLISHYSGAHLIGTFAVVQTTYVLTTAIVRSITSDCLLTRSDSQDLMARYEHAGFLAKIWVALIASVLIAGVGLAFTSDLRVAFLILAVSFPFLSCMDFARYLGIHRYNPMYAFALDASWLLLFVLGYLVLRTVGLVSMPYVFGAWCGAGVLVGLYTLWNHLPLHDWRSLTGFWITSERAVGLRFAAEAILWNSWAYAATFILVAIFSITEVGYIKLAAWSIMPMTVISAGIGTALVAVASKYFSVDPKKAVRFVVGTAMLIAVICVLITFAIYAVPVAKMTKVLGPAWPGARGLVILTGLGVATLTVGGTLAAGLRAMRAAKVNLRIGMAVLPVSFVLSIGGALLWGVKAALAGAIIGNGLYATATFVWLIKEARRFQPATESTPLPDVDADVDADAEEEAEVEAEVVTEGLAGAEI